MSARNPLSVIKDVVYGARRRAYHVKKLRDPNAIAEYCLTEVEAMIDPKLMRQALLAWIRDLCTNRKEQTDFTKPDLFRDYEYQFVIRHGKTSESIELGDITLTEIPLISQQKIDNINAATAEKIRWDRHLAVIEPILHKHPKWKWKDACKWLEKHGGFPDVE